MAAPKQTRPTTVAEATLPTAGAAYLNRLVTGHTLPRTKLGVVVATVLRMLVPNCSLASVTNSTQ